MKNFRTYLSLAIGVSFIVYARVKGMHLTEMELLIAYWPHFLAAFACFLVSSTKLYWSKSK